MKAVYLASSVQDLALLAEQSLPPIDNGVKLINYYRSAQQLLMQANIYKSEGDFEKAYIHMMKYSILMLQKLPKHIQYGQPEVQPSISTARDMVRKLIGDMEAMKLVLQKLYDDEVKAKELQKRKEQEEALAKQREIELRRQQEEAERAAQEAYEQAQREEQQRQEQAERQRRDMELFESQQLQAQQKQLNERQVPQLRDNGDGLLLPIQSNMESLQLQDPLSPPPQEQGLPEDFFMGAPLPPPMPMGEGMQFMPPVDPSLDFLTPLPPPPSSPSVAPPSSADASAPLLDITPETYARIPEPIDRYSHLETLAPPPREVPHKSDSMDNIKPPVEYPNLYSKANAPPATVPYVPSTSSSNYNATATSARPQQAHASAPRATHASAPPSQAYAGVPAQMHASAPPMYTPPPNFMPPVYAQPPSMPSPYNMVYPPSSQHPQIPYQQQQQNSQRHAQPQSPQPQQSPQPRPPQSPQPRQQIQPPAHPAQQRAAPASNFMPSLPTSPVVTSKPSANPKPSASQGRIEESPTDLFGPSKPNVNNGLRRVVVYGEMFEAFMRVAQANTARKIETCAVLSGTLSKNTFYITTMIVPKQVGTSDTCSTTHEEELFDYQMKNDLLTLGWIHTHPTQDCFMSSVDLHTHCTYQLLLPEAIAVVISPMYTPNFGVFRVSDPPGMQIIQKCNLRGFHQHADSYGKTLYTLCDHVDLVWKSKNFKVVDLR